MPIHNLEVAQKFNKLANLLEIQGANPFRIRAYRNAARVIDSLSKDIADMIAEKEDLTELPGIGEDLAEKIKTIIKTGELPLLKQVEKRIPSVLSELLEVEGLGPMRVKMLYKNLKIKSIEDLKTAIKKGRVRKLAGFGEKTEKKILQGITHRYEYAKRNRLADTFSIVDSLIRHLKRDKTVKQVECAGSFRRRKETVGDLDILATAEDGKKNS